MSNWIDNAFNKAKVSDGSEINVFLNKFPKLLTAFEKTMGSDEFDHIVQTILTDKTMMKFVALCFGAGMVEARMKMLQDSTD